MSARAGGSAPEIAETAANRYLTDVKHVVVPGERGTSLRTPGGLQGGEGGYDASILCKVRVPQ